MSNIKQRKKLDALYRTGCEVRFRAGQEPLIADPSKNKGLLVKENGKPLPVGDDEVQVWVRPPSPLQREMAIRDAQASRARSLVRAKRAEDSEEHLTILAFLVDMSFETLVDYVLLAGADKRSDDAVREVLAEEEWKDITSIQDALRQFEEMDEEELAAHKEEYDAIMEQDAKFGSQVTEREKELANSERELLESRSREQLEKKALERRAEIVGQQAFMFEYEQQMLFYSVRDFDDNGVLFFGSARELAESDEEIINACKEAMTMFINDSGEAKNSRGVASGSEQSEPPSAPETFAPSIPEVVNG